jgi:glycosyltransferase involved in cell wall biosynthesis
MRVALVHYWLLGSRGGEKVLEAIARIFPDADIFTLFYDPELVSPAIRARNVQASYLNPLRRFYRGLLPLMPMALESFDLRGYDLVISSESGPAKGVLTSASTRHICYCHTPMRYLWELYPAYRQELGGGLLARSLGALVSNYLRTWDATTALRVDQFLANSRNVRRRIWRVYRRKSRVVYPPVAIERFLHKPAEDYFLIVSEMVSYKRLDYAVRLFTKTGRKLKIVGSGPEYKALRRMAGPGIEFCGRVPDAELPDLYARSRALLMPGEEDFGMTMVESLASGKPVIGLGRGGAEEIVTNGCGLLYDEASETSLDTALHDFNAMEAEFAPELMRERAAEFSAQAFERKILKAVASLTKWNLRSFYNPLTPPTEANSYHPPHEHDRSARTDRRAIDVRSL